MTKTTTVNNSNAPAISVNVTDASCYGYSDGAIDLSVTGGTTPYVYIWTWEGGGSFVEDINTLTAGTYTVMIQDASNCWTGTSVVVNEPALSTNISVTNVGCAGGNDGTASVSVSDGFPPFLYLWSNSDKTGSIDSLYAGTYTVEVTDSNGCIINDTAIITEPVAITTSLSATDVSCFNGSDGAIDLTVSGGAPPYTYLWSDINSSTSQDVNLLSANTYYVTITDSCGGSASDSIVINEPALLAISISATDVTCYGGGDGTATATPSGGTAPYNYMWNNGQTDSAAVGLFHGFHAVNVFDVNGCIASNNITVNEPSVLSFSIIGTDAGCYGGADGAADLTISGGTAPYSFLWDDPAASTTEDISTLTAGTYNVVITDSCGFAVFDNVIISEPPAPGSSIVKSDISCNGNNDGSVTLTATGGTLPYTYLWDDPGSSNTKDLSNLGAGTYVVNITDRKSVV